MQMMDHFYKIIEVEWTTLYIIVGVSVIATALKRELFGGTWIAFSAVPVYVFTSLVVLYSFRQSKLVSVSEKEIEAVIAVTVGVTAAFLFYLVLVDIYRVITSWHVSRMIKNRNLNNVQRDR